MKTYVLTIAKTFPAYMPSKGQNTDFSAKIASKTKLHTIRTNYPLWAKRFEAIAQGRACLSVREWTGKPYRSPQVELFRLTADDGIGLQKFQVIDSVFTIDDKPSNIVDIAKNDGLYPVTFINWFGKYLTPQSPPFAVIHFTDFRY